ncbi:hypothetical protein FL966_09960 [Caproiciproducens galactitolivorans]|uniref:DUF4345 domain-containing protein n=1 Tax=Caproiciproducens galactitolivorans TaxID=642589 RepID=A0A4Z0XZY6_9FIRM|nr:hypothetical protein [Caproiciproducens galactitolivorans]QEY35344.1 hypothetical protein FL966_09960 [Caproiciproducens galactitolivorans]TGJ77044.1 hypothetical protein CAGA_11190 [Caproiciproducens galactitolivorans]
MSKKQVKGIVILLQLFLIGALFLPAGTIIGSAKNQDDATLSVFRMMDRYAGMGFADDARFYMIFAGLFPAAVIVLLLVLKERKNFEAGIILSAFYATASACFYSAAKTKMVDYATMTILPNLIILVSLLSLVMLIRGFFMDTPEGAAKRKN